MSDELVNVLWEEVSSGGKENRHDAFKGVFELKVENGFTVKMLRCQNDFILKFQTGKMLNCHKIKLSK